jgi:hypothetical protein
MARFIVRTLERRGLERMAFVIAPNWFGNGYPDISQAIRECQRACEADQRCDFRPLPPAPPSNIFRVRTDYGV